MAGQGRFPFLPFGAGFILLFATLSQAKDLIKVEGSSTVYPITYQLAKNYMLATGDKTQIVVGITGTGGGFRKFCRGRTDISNASRPIKPSEIELCKANGIEFLELPIALDAITVVINKNNDWLNTLTLHQLDKIWQGSSHNKIRSWHQFDERFPKTPLNLHGPGSDSGTYDYFVDVVLNQAKIRQDYTANEDDRAMAAEVAADPNAMAFLGFAYYLENRDKIKAVAITNRSGTPTIPSMETVKNGHYNYLSRPLFVYINQSALKQRKSVKRFLDHYFHPHNIERVVKKSGYIPLSSQAYNLARDTIKTGRSGSEYSSEGMSANLQPFLQ